MGNTMRRLLFFAGCLIGLWLFFVQLTPRLLALSPAWQRYDAVQEQYDIDSGALYYSNVPVTEEAEKATREAVRRGMKVRRARARAAGAGNGEN